MFNFVILSFFCMILILPASSPSTPTPTLG